MIKRKFELLEHPSDIYVAAYGTNLEEAFENAALAMFETMTDVALVKPLVKSKIEVESEDEQSLLYDWLEALLVKFEVENILLSFFKVHKIKRFRDMLRIEGEVAGEPYDPEKHFSKVGIKAVTYYGMEILRENGTVTLKVLFDI